MRPILAYLVLFLALVWTSNAGEACKTFNCGSFDPTSEDVCVLVPDGNPHDLVRTCADGKQCTALKWKYIDKAFENAVCTEIADAPVNKTLPGGKCQADQECFGMAGEVSCTNGACTTVRKEGAFCEDTNGIMWVIYPGTWWCDTGLFCNTNINQCVKQRTEGDRCNYFTQCQFGYGCIYSLNEEYTTCHKLWSLKEGEQFDTFNFNEISGVFSYDVMCETGYAYKTDRSRIYECRKPPFSKDVKTVDDLKRPGGAGEICPFYAYDDPNDRDNLLEMTDFSTCGFNVDSSGYCNKRIGDKWYQDALKKVRSKDLTQVKCNPYVDPKDCPSFHNVLGEDLYTEWLRENLVLENYMSWAIFANNDRCTAESITAQYWNHKTPKSDVKEMISE